MVSLSVDFCTTPRASTAATGNELSQMYVQRMASGRLFVSGHMYGLGEIILAELLDTKWGRKRGIRNRLLGLQLIVL